jgi:hypothetical protein
MLIIDTECYSDYWLFSALQISTGKVLHVDFYPGKVLDKRKIAGAMSSTTTISFNGLSYDLVMITAALSGYNPAQLKTLSDNIIKSKAPSWRLCRELNIEVPTNWDHIDLIEVALGQSSLKIYGGRLNAPKMQDLPIPPDASIAPDQRPILRTYCENDLETTLLLWNKLEPAVALREQMGKRYGMDLRSKSDAQIAETVIKSELSAITGDTYRAPSLADGYGFYYRDPEIISFASADLQSVFQRILKTRFTLGLNGAVKMPDWLKDTRIKIGDAEYQMGIGGLHSCEKSQLVQADDDHLLQDWDVASYYPSIILQQRLAPKSLGEPFLKVYRSIVERRLRAKKSGDMVTADTLKIAINGSFGKLGSKYSALYAPDLLIQTTLTGQLALLMLIERMTAAGVRVVSANTDGVVLHFHKDIGPDVEAVAWDWMLDTSYELERTDYRTLASRDVNNYVAVKLDGSVKGKGVFAPPGLSKNPDGQIVYEAVAKQLASGVPVVETITACQDITKFCTIRRVQGGAKWRDQLLGKAVRFYLSTSVPEAECIHYATNSNRVPNSAGAMPLMELPGKFPGDVDYQAYVTAAEKLLCEVGAC